MLLERKKEAISSLFKNLEALDRDIQELLRIRSEEGGNTDIVKIKGNIYEFVMLTMMNVGRHSRNSELVKFIKNYK